ncbi:response regulator [Halobaculum halobium]|uniref:Response regulator n=1 Tax=Halobaculum halobium TaxID=3032281 RepID=A0ABD5TFJ1_9EURY
MFPPIDGAVASVQSVLVVDDDRPMTELLTDRLDRDLDGAEVSGTTEPADVLDAVERGSANCIVSDYDMPSIDGLSLLRRIRGDRPARSVRPVHRTRQRRDRERSRLRRRH